MHLKIAGEDEGIEEEVLGDALAVVAELKAEMEQHLAAGAAGELVRAGVRVAIVGEPNVGKSSLLNALSKRDVAIVTSEAGTTRDVIEVAAELGSLPVVFSDTAGVREGPDVGEVEREGIRRALQTAEAADLRICLQAPPMLPTGKGCVSVSDSTDGDGAAAAVRHACKCGSNIGGAECESDGGHKSLRTLLVVNKADAPNADQFEPRCPSCDGHVKQPRKGSGSRTGGGGGGGDGDGSSISGSRVLWISCKSGEGIPELLGVLEEEVAELCAGAAGDAALCNVRHRAHMKDCVASLATALANPADVVYAAEELRHAAHQFGHITGRFDMEAVMDVIFSEFCIGK